MRIEYEEQNQIENGHELLVTAGIVPLITYSFYVYVGEDTDPVFLISVDTIEQGYKECIAWVSENCAVMLKEVKKPSLVDLVSLIAVEGVRNGTLLEDLHAGKPLKTSTGDYSDVSVVTPYGAIPWTEVSRISDSEMRELMLSIELMVKSVLGAYEILPAEARAFMLEMAEQGRSWDEPDYKGV